MQFVRARLRAGFTALVLASTLTASFATVAPATTQAATVTPAQVIIADAERHLGARYVWGTMGPYTFDCSGLVLAVFKETGYYYVVGSGAYRSAYALYSYFSSRGLASPHDGRPGDLAIFGGGAHVGIYLGGGKVLSALVTGVSINSIGSIYPRFTTFLHTGMAGLADVTKASMYVRSGPSTAYGAVTSIGAGRQVSVLAVHRDPWNRTWDEVRLASGTVGWIPGWQAKMTGFAWTNQGAWVYAGPGYTWIADIAGGTHIYVYTTVADTSARVWAKERSSTTRGYFAGWDLRP